MRCRRCLYRTGFGLLLVMAACVVQAADGLTVLAGATVFDASGAEPLRDAVVVIRGDTILAVGPADEVPVPAGSTVQDVRGKWIMPGLVDAHVHFFQSGGLYTRPDVIDLRHIRPYAREIAGLRNRLPDTLARYLASGVTSVVDLAGPDWVLDLRPLAGSLPEAPRLVISGPGLAPYLPRGLDGRHAPAVVVRTPAQARAAVQRLAEHRPDLIKIWFVPRPGMDLDREFRWVQAAADEAHAHGLRVAAHATQLDIARRMVAAGADILVHSIDDRPIDDTLLAQLRDRQVLYIPTLGVSQRYAEVLGQRLRLSAYERALGDPWVIATLDDMAWLFPQRGKRTAIPDNATARENLLRVHQAGITIAAGSDAGNIGTLHGPALHHELELMAEAGLAPVDVLIAATRGGARVMGRGNELGRLAPGYRADLLVLEASPLRDIRNTRRIALVMKDGRFVHCVPARLSRSCPE
jgi:imidazolonepropionase-like amidohydrolase